MAKKTVIRLNTDVYRAPTQKELDEARNVVVRRQEAIDALRRAAAEKMQDTAGRLAEIAVQYEISPEEFAFDSSVNEEMMSRAADEMEELEDSLMEMTEAYATRDAEDNGMRALLLALLVSLGHRNMGLKDTIHEYLWRTLRQTEGLIAAAKAAGRTPTQIVSLVRSNIGSAVYNADMQRISRYRHLYRSPFINSGGKATYSDGSPNVQGVPVNGVDAALNAITNAASKTIDHKNLIEMQQNGAIGYWQARGSDYDCGICDEEVGFHPLGDMEYDDYPHINCCCIRIPIYSKEELNNY